MRLDGIEKDSMIVNPYRNTEIEILNTQNAQSIQKNRLNQLKNQKDLTEEFDNNKKLTLSQEELNKMMEEIKHKFNMLEKYLQIDIDQQLQIPISKIIDMKTQEIIRQIPPEWIVEILRRMEELKGVFYFREV
uniref:Flagellar protein FlaG n=1 Tax=Thermodesulfovibrio aggregans TaxID=86166 RepID=A0A7C4AJI5_9BACT